MGLLAGELLELPLPSIRDRLLVILETDGCFADGIEVSTGCSVGKRSLRIEDYGKVAATFVDTHKDLALRLVPAPDIRLQACDHTGLTKNRYQAQLIGYQSMPASEMFTVQEVSLKKPLSLIISRPGLRVLCDSCGEEIINQREIQTSAELLCMACAGDSYYKTLQ
jgi:formylmethanofuran dehydrogenase subunit E